jgi:hypothetical protein
MAGARVPAVFFGARPSARAQEGQLESAGALTLVSNPVDFRFVCCGRVPTREAECPQNTRSLVANLPNFDFRFWVGTDQVRGERAPGEAIVRKAGVLAGPWLARCGR